MSAKLELLCQKLQEILGDRIQSLKTERGEVSLEVAPAVYREVALVLRDHPELCFDQLLDLCGVDYSTYGEGLYSGKPFVGRFAAVSHLTSLKNIVRLRLRTFAADDAFPVLDSVIDVWPSVSWFEREAFDMFGIMFAGHPDLRRILTDYGFVGHPFRKDFPISGYVEMRYDPDLARVIYQPVTIEPRENTPRIVREANYGDVGHG